jgi:hypothetical protein
MIQIEEQQLERSEYIAGLRQQNKAEAKEARQRSNELLLNQQQEVLTEMRNSLNAHLRWHEIEKARVKTRDEKDRVEKAIAKDLLEKEIAALKADAKREVSELVVADLVDGLKAAAAALDVLSNEHTALQARVENLEDALRLLSSSKAVSKGKSRY